MARPLEPCEVEQLLGEARRMLALSIEVEDQLGALVSYAGAQPAVGPLACAGGQASAEQAALRPLFGGGLREQAGRLCTAAREQRVLAESMVAALRQERVDDAQGSRPARVLVVDDSQDARELATTLLEIAGYRVSTARNGLEAIIAAHDLRPAVVLMDISMPVLDGIEATRLLKTHPTTRRLPVIAHTAHPGLVHGSTGTLFAEILPKPSLPDVVIASVQRLSGG